MTDKFVFASTIARSKKNSNRRIFPETKIYSTNFCGGKEKKYNFAAEMVEYHSSIFCLGKARTSSALPSAQRNGCSATREWRAKKGMRCDSSTVPAAVIPAF